MPVDPFALNRLLAIGIVRLERDIDNVLEDLNTHSTTQYDDWPTLNPFLRARRICLSVGSLETYNELETLQRLKFLKARWQFRDGLVHVRIYLIPNDLAGVQGGLAMSNRKHDDIIAGRQYMKSLLCKTFGSLAAWECNQVCDENTKIMTPHERDTRTISEIYSDLPSPIVDPSAFLSRANPNVREVFLQALTWERPRGMRTTSTLYEYQRRTLAGMLQQELQPNDAQDPLYISLHSVHGDNTFYLQPTTMEVLHEVPYRSQVKGGILCEEMGSGKTCIILALILATKDQLSSPEENLGEPPKVVLTPTALCHFPSKQFRQEREAARMISQCGFPTLREVVTYFLRVHPPEVCLQSESLMTVLESIDHLAKEFYRDVPFYHVVEPEPTTAPAKRRKSQPKGPRRIYLTTATLIIVPRSLMGQWQGEIRKHCVDGLRLYVSGIHGHSKLKPLPHAQKLASNYDIVLLTHERFAAESSQCEIDQLPEWHEKFCGGHPYCKASDCHCHHSYGRNVSSLIQIRWKRLVVDEGHVSVATNDLARLCSILNAERRWIVSGTPTRNLMGLSLGQTSDDLTSESFDDVELLEDGQSLEDIQTSLLVGELTYPQDVCGKRWGSTDRDDLNKISQMLARFLKLPQFSNDPKAFRDYVRAPLLHPHGPRFGSVKVLTQVMCMVMFRHQIQDIEKDLPHSLPVLKEKTVKLKFHPMAALSYNVLQAGIAVNAVDTERRDQDYFFHSSSRGALRDVLENLRQAMFWRTDSSIYDIDKAVKRTKAALQTAIQRGRPSSDIELVENSLKIQRQARDDELWRLINEEEDCPFSIHGLSEPVQDAWLSKDRQGNIHRHGENSVPSLGPKRLIELRKFILERPLASEGDFISAGHAVQEKEEQEKMAYEEYLARRKKRKTHAHSETEDNHKLKEFVEKATRNITEGEQMVIPTIQSSSSPNLIVGDTMSTKLNYILRKVKKHEAVHKFLIFSALPLSLAFISDALDIANIPHCAYTSLIKPPERQTNILTFETSDKFRVLLVELKFGARGLNIVSASRIIFCEPIWQGDVEAQAIKRAHRIGQKCKVLKVATLVMKGTSEELMISRRKALKNKSQKLTAVYEDGDMRKFLQNPTFIQDEDVEIRVEDGLRIPLVRKREPLMAIQDATMEVDEENDRNDNEREDNERENRPRKKVRFS